nr:hypothetical protein CFP56_69388 [Quercus suber]
MEEQVPDTESQVYDNRSFYTGMTPGAQHGGNDQAPVQGVINVAGPPPGPHARTPSTPPAAPPPQRQPLEGNPPPYTEQASQQPEVQADMPPPPPPNLQSLRNLGVELTALAKGTEPPLFDGTDEAAGFPAIVTPAYMNGQHGHIERQSYWTAPLRRIFLREIAELRFDLAWRSLPTFLERLRTTLRTRHQLLLPRDIRAALFTGDGHVGWLDMRAQEHEQGEGAGGFGFDAEDRANLDAIASAIHARTQILSIALAATIVLNLWQIRRLTRLAARRRRRAGKGAWEQEPLHDCEDSDSDSDNSDFDLSSSGLASLHLSHAKRQPRRRSNRVCKFCRSGGKPASRR